MSTCEWCHAVFERPSALGPEPRYCSRSHRQRAFEARRAERLAAPLNPGAVDDAHEQLARLTKAIKLADFIDARDYDPSELATWGESDRELTAKIVRLRRPPSDETWKLVRRLVSERRFARELYGGVAPWLTFTIVPGTSGDFT